MKKILSYSLFRSPVSRFEKPEAQAYRGRFFTAHIPVLLRAAAANFPGWEVRIHHDGQMIWNCDYGEVLVRLEDLGLIKLVNMGQPKTLCGGMLWRMAPLWQQHKTGPGDVVLTRDMDSIPTPRERRCVDEWLASGLAVHAIHDHPYHAGTALMGGMCGFRSKPFVDAAGLKSLDDLIGRAAANGIGLNTHGDDQRLLNAVVWPKMRKHTLMHQLKSTQDEGAAKTSFKVPVVAPEPWMGSADIRDLGPTPHIGAVFTEYDGDTYQGPTFDPVVVGGRLNKALRFYGREFKLSDPPEPDQLTLDSIIAAEAHTHTDIQAMILSRNLKDRRAIFSCDHSLDYAFCLPITARLWRDVVGFTPVALLVGTADDWNASPPHRVALRELRAVGAEVYFVRKMEGHLDSTVAQVARLFCGCLPVEDNAYLMTSDVDMWALSKPFFRDVDAGKALHVLFANAYMKDDGRGGLVPEGKYPICYLGAAAATWRRIMQVQNPKSLDDSLQWQLDNGLGRGAGSSAAWHYDENLLMIRLAESQMIPHQAQMRNRTGAPPRDRIDRGDWRNAPAIEAASDCHLLRPAQHADHWPKVRPIILAKLGEEGAKWADSYRTAFTGGEQ